MTDRRDDAWPSGRTVGGVLNSETRVGGGDEAERRRGQGHGPNGNERRRYAARVLDKRSNQLNLFKKY
ncbi:hypothetical protein ACEUZ9_000357 [Paracoccus litorisediminis]|uniref:hypothetical protein n=1 Tax=Paracoccus litorisediminis TaxID=2006130 RepID=UPI00372EBC5E